MANLPSRLHWAARVISASGKPPSFVIMTAFELRALSLKQHRIYQPGTSQPHLSPANMSELHILADDQWTNAQNNNKLMLILRIIRHAIPGRAVRKLCRRSGRLASPPATER